MKLERDLGDGKKKIYRPLFGSACCGFATADPSFRLLSWTLFDIHGALLLDRFRKIIVKMATGKQLKDLWFLTKKRRRFYSYRVKFLLVNMSASWFLVSTYLIWILGSKLILSNNHSRATLWVLETFLILGLRPLIIIFITASLSSKMYCGASPKVPHLFWRAHQLPASPFQCPRSRAATLEVGRVFPSLNIEPSPLAGVRPASDPVDSDPGARFPWSPPRIEPKLARVLDVHTREPVVLSRVSCRPAPECWPFFTSLACYPGAPLAATETRLAVGQGSVRTVVCVPHDDHLPLRAAQFLLAPRWRYFPRRLDGATAGR